jgi:DNA processing protein
MEVLEAAQRQDIQIIVRGTDRMPRQLATAPDPPLLLFARGNLACLSGNAPVAVVGTRTPSDFGRRVAERFGQRLAGHHHTVVSGLAIGCDTAAHQGCLAAGGKTVAVLAHGLDMTYPAVNKSLAAVIVDRGGCLLSEYLPGTRPRSSYFVERDRIQSGLSFGVLVVETTQDGGTMHTARYCMAQGRALGCLVHPETERENGVLDGNLVLLEQHTAIPIRDEGDLVAFLSKTRSRQANVG